MPANIVMEPWQMASVNSAPAIAADAQARKTDQERRTLAYNQQQLEAANAIMSRHLDPSDPTTGPDWQKAMNDPDTQRLGLQPVLLSAYLGQKTNMARAGSDIAANTLGTEGMGFDSKTLIPPQPSPVPVNGQNLASGGMDAATKDGLRAWMTGSGSRSSKTPVGATVSGPAPDVAAVGDQPGQISVSGQRGDDGARDAMLPPAGPTEYQNPREDVLTALQRSYDPSRIGGGMGGAGGAGGGAAPQIQTTQAKQTWAKELDRQGLLPSDLPKDAQGNVMLTPEAEQAIQGGFQKLYGMRLAAIPAPTPAQFMKPGEGGRMVFDQGGFQAAIQKYGAERAAIGQKLYEEGSSIFGTQFGQTLSGQANDRAEQTQTWTKQGREAVTSMGLDAARVNPEQAVDLISRKNTLTGMADMVDQNGPDLTGANGPYAQRAAITAVLTNLSKIEQVGTEAGNMRLNTLLEFAPGVQKALQEHGIQGVPDAFVKSMAANPQEGLNALKKMVEMTQRDGVLVGQLKAAGMKEPFGKPEPSGPPMFKDPSDPAFQALPSGASFVGPDGKKRVKR